VITLGRPARTIYLTGLAQGLAGAAFPASAVVLRGQGLSDAQYGSLFVPQMALAALGAAAGSWVMRGLGAQRALSFGTLLMGLSQAALLVAGLAHGGVAFPVALLGTSLLGLGAGIAAGPVNAYPQLLFPRRAESAVLAQACANSSTTVDAQSEFKPMPP
jgi:MFS family permease